MKVTGSTPVRPGSGATRTNRSRKSGTRATEAVTTRRSVDDVATFLGITEAELTVNVRSGLARLLQEVDRMRREMAAMAKRVAYLEQLADEDPLTPIMNRRAFVRELTRQIAYAERYDVPSSVLYFDVNGMKEINDRYGHSAGDAALTHVANMLLANLRTSDIVGRLGGDEFAAILHQADLEAARVKAADLATVISETPFEHGGQSITMQISVGAFAFDGQSSPDEVLDQADREMYAQKRATKADQPDDTGEEADPTMALDGGTQPEKVTSSGDDIGQ